MKYATQIQRLAVRLYRMRPEEKRATLRDRALAERLRNAFERDLHASKAGGIHVYALDGNVTLYGSVRHQLDR
ncbi:MAG TPA: BON domain-containing protein, partial [Rhodothermales bacterium]|nr:BON domain-containing protein [Rhodothermales bacterium]